MCVSSVSVISVWLCQRVSVSVCGGWRVSVSLYLFVCVCVHVCVRVCVCACCAGITKTHSLVFEDCEIFQAVFRQDSAPNRSPSPPHLCVSVCA
ncbi:MAG: hypothetical protein P4L40_03280 [Terracidiphilus sp.]|nr:hypothetical protein [Terracidiphilus sp.]